LIILVAIERKMLVRIERKTKGPMMNNNIRIYEIDNGYLVEHIGDPKPKSPNEDMMMLPWHDAEVREKSHYFGKTPQEVAAIVNQLLAKRVANTMNGDAQ